MTRIERLGDLDLVETIYEKRDRIAYVTLNREHAGNSFNVQMCNEMEAIWTDFRDDDDTWVSILTSAGEKFFCTGVDVKESRTRPMGHVWLPIARLMEQLHKPIICAVNGMCCGGGLHFLCDTDIIIGSENAQFFDPHVNVGLDLRMGADRAVTADPAELRAAHDACRARTTVSMPRKRTASASSPRSFLRIVSSLARRRSRRTC